MNEYADKASIMWLRAAEHLHSLPTCSHLSNPLTPDELCGACDEMTEEAWAVLSVAEKALLESGGSFGDVRLRLTMANHDEATHAFLDSLIVAMELANETATDFDLEG